MATSSKSNDDVLKKLIAGELKLHELDALLGEKEAAKVRRIFLEKKLQVRLDEVSSGKLDPAMCGPNIENMIGSVKIPLGIAGPVKIKGQDIDGEFFIPLATSEGALVASVSRGCSAISKSGGAVSVILKNGQSRSILFRAKDIVAAKDFSEWVEKNKEELKAAGKKDERFLEIKDLVPYVVGINVWLRIIGDTNDAMGMNMVTIAGKKIAGHVSKNYEDVEFVSESGNMCVDKKPSAMNLVSGRGKSVSASVELTSEVIRNVLKTTPEKLVDMNYRKNLLGSAASGSLGYNAHFANIVAAMFIATGQDAAHVVDGSLGFTTVERTWKGVLFSVNLPDLQVGTIGGGTGLPSQKECLSLLGVAGPAKVPGENSAKLAKIVSVAVLAGEISLLGALCTRDLSKAHQRLNR